MAATTRSAVTRLAPATRAATLAIHRAPSRAAVARLALVEAPEEPAYAREDRLGLETPGNAGKIYRHRGPRFLSRSVIAIAVGTI